MPRQWCLLWCVFHVNEPFTRHTKSLALVGSPPDACVFPAPSGVGVSPLLFSFLLGEEEQGEQVCISPFLVIGMGVATKVGASFSTKNLCASPLSIHYVLSKFQRYPQVTLLSSVRLETTVHIPWEDQGRWWQALGRAGEIFRDLSHPSQCVL